MHYYMFFQEEMCVSPVASKAPSVDTFVTSTPKMCGGFFPEFFLSNSEISSISADQDASCSQLIVPENDIHVHASASSCIPKAWTKKPLTDKPLAHKREAPGDIKSHKSPNVKSLAMSTAPSAETSQSGSSIPVKPLARKREATANVKSCPMSTTKSGSNVPVKRAVTSSTGKNPNACANTYKREVTATVKSPMESKVGICIQIYY